MSRLFCSYFEPGHFSFRVCGYGVSAEDRRIHPALFSERYGYSRVLRVGPWSLKFLRPRKP